MCYLLWLSINFLYKWNCRYYLKSKNGDIGIIQYFNYVTIERLFIKLRIASLKVMKIILKIF